MDTFNLVKLAIVEHAGVDMEDIKPNSTFGDLDMDSLDEIELLMLLEETHGVTFDDDEYNGGTVSDLAVLLAKKLNVPIKEFYRVSSPETEQGLWYNFNGEFTGLIHTEFNFCKNSELLMDFDTEIVGWLSAVKSIEDLFVWFSKEDIIKLQERGWFIHKYETTNYKFYERFQHQIICQNNSRVVEKIVINN